MASRPVGELVFNQARIETLQIGIEGAAKPQRKIN
jgi:hypothetical protein